VEKIWGRGGVGWDGNDNRALKGNGDIEVWFRYVEG